jgi:hypothetical protein
MKHLATFVLLIFLAGCPKPFPPTPPGPGTTDAGTDAEEAKRPCLAACRRLSKLACESARPTPEGASCTLVCENVQASGVISWNIECIRKAESCAAADLCNR